MTTFDNKLAHPGDTSTEAQQTTIDGLVRRSLALLASTGPRRRFVSIVAQGILTALGVGLVPKLPFVDRFFRAEATVNCFDWQLCGIFGMICDCCGGNTDNGVCPSASHPSTQSWSACCASQSGVSYNVSYVDCCYPCGGEPCRPCNCLFCRNGPQEPSWCQGPKNAGYGCTIAVVGSTC